MNSKRSIQYKAAVLMIVFSLNTLIGFACAIGIDMGFNTEHHHAEKSTEAPDHTHNYGNKHVPHQEVKGHEDADNDHHQKEGSDNCCNHKVVQFNEIDKCASHSLTGTISPVFSAIFLASFFYMNIVYTSYIDSGINYFVRSYHPPIPDIRIAIQSFQI